MIELIQLTHTEGGVELLAAHEQALYALGGRPHWGQINTLTGSNGLLEQPVLEAASGSPPRGSSRTAESHTVGWP